MWICRDWSWKVQTKRVALAERRGRGGGCPTSPGQVSGVAQRLWRGGGRSALRPGAAAAAPLAPGGSPRPGLDARPATSTDSLLSLRAWHRSKVRGASRRGFFPSTPRADFWLPRFFPFPEWSSFVKLYLHLAHAGGRCSRPPWQRGLRSLMGTERRVGGEDLLAAVVPIWIKIVFRNNSQVLPSGGVLHYDVPCDAGNGFPCSFCTEGRTSLQEKVHEKQVKFAAT